MNFFIEYLRAYNKLWPKCIFVIKPLLSACGVIAKLINSHLKMSNSKLIDWKGILFWSSYYGAWIYGLHKHRPGGSHGRIRDQLDEASETMQDMKEQLQRKVDELVSHSQAVSGPIDAAVKQTVDSSQKAIKQTKDAVLEVPKEAVKSATKVTEKLAKETEKLVETSKVSINEMTSKFIKEEEIFVGKVKDIATEEVGTAKIAATELISTSSDVSAEGPKVVTSSTASVIQTEHVITSEIPMEVHQLQEPILGEGFLDETKKAADYMSKQVGQSTEKLIQEVQQVVDQLSKDAPRVADQVTAGLAEGTKATKEVVTELANEMKPITGKILYEAKQLGEEVAKETPKVVEKAIQQTNETVTELGKQMAPVTEMIVKEVIQMGTEVAEQTPQVADKVIQQVQEVISEVTKDVPQIAEQTVQEVQQITNSIPQKLQKVSETVSKLSTLAGPTTQLGVVPTPISTTVTSVGEVVVEHADELVNCNVSTATDCAKIMTELPLMPDWQLIIRNWLFSALQADRPDFCPGWQSISWPQCTGLNEWPVSHNSQ